MKLHCCENFIDCGGSKFITWRDTVHKLMKHLELEALLTVEEQSSLPGEAHCGITYATFAMIEMNNLDNW